jgi:pyruvate ferredoxin oxidoreductase gamma subunit
VSGSWTRPGDGARRSFAIRIHGRGGQGVVTAAELLSITAFAEGLEAQAFPSFGSERMGAPVVSYCRISAAPIVTHEPVAYPDALVVQDETLLHQVDVFAGLRPDGFVVVNSRRDWIGLGLGDLHHRHDAERLITVPATDVARETIGRPMPNTVLLGALAALTGIVSLAGLQRQLHARFAGESGTRNAAAAAAGHQWVVQSAEPDRAEGSSGTTVAGLGAPSHA